ncbi:hypothetical protein B0H10DRAFT_1772943 [Mycena sp. CBHHK59/15]|nr:hypothetical protein B0H10DRAFT_1772943 [Mycena sp. CBHHK59/15]
MSQLPPTFTSLYRLFLRTSSASVLHHRTTTSNLRKLWRPSFEDAARVTVRLQSYSLSAVKRNELEIWLQTWHYRIDNTLAMLYTSCKTRGLSHQLSRNLGLLVRAEQARVNLEKLPVWKAKLSAGAPEYQSDFRDPHLKGARKRYLDRAHAWDAIEEVVRMAEGAHGFSLGRMALKKTRFRSVELATD